MFYTVNYYKQRVISPSNIKNTAYAFCIKCRIFVKYKVSVVKYKYPFRITFN
jgi:hypothetical protein